MTVDLTCGTLGNDDGRMRAHGVPAPTYRLVSPFAPEGIPVCFDCAQELEDRLRLNRIAGPHGEALERGSVQLVGTL